MYKKTQHVHVRFVLICLCLSVILTAVVAAESYDASKALQYADAHWNTDKAQKCAEFVSNCLKAGGITTAWNERCTTLLGQLEGSGLGTKHKLNVNSDGTITVANNSGILSPGDVIFVYSTGCTTAAGGDGRPYVHAYLYSGADSSGYANGYAHNDALKGRICVYFKCSDCKKQTDAAYVFHMNGSGQTSSRSSSGYKTGTYRPSASDGLNIRSGASTSYSVVGAIAYGTSFTVTKVSGNWGYTTSGGKSGWVCLDYATYVSTSSDTGEKNATGFVNYVKGQVGSTFKSNACQTFVFRMVYYYFGKDADACCASKAWSNFGVASDRNIPLGAAVYFGNAGVIDELYCGKDAGHSAIYVGNNTIVHAWNAKIVSTTIDYVTGRGYTYRGWGWQANYQIPQGTGGDQSKSYTIDVNGYLDGTYVTGLNGYVTFDMLINGTCVSKGVGDFCTQYPTGTKYEVTNIKAASGYKYVSGKNLSGTVKDGQVNVLLYVESDTAAGEWSKWSTTKPDAKDNRTIESKTQYGYYHYVHKWTDTGFVGAYPVEDYRVFTTDPSDEVKYHEYWTDAQLSSSGTWTDGSKTYTAYTNRCCDLGTNVSKTAKDLYSLDKTRTIYRYKDAKTEDPVPTVPGEWSAWSTTKPQSKTDRVIESKTQYGYYHYIHKWTKTGTVGAYPVKDAGVFTTNPSDEAKYHEYWTDVQLPSAGSFTCGGKSYTTYANRCCNLGSKVNAGATGMYSLGKTRTIYRYLDDVPSVGVWSAWSTTKPQSKTDRTVESKAQYGYYHYVHKWTKTGTVGAYPVKDAGVFTTNPSDEAKYHEYWTDVQLPAAGSFTCGGKSYTTYANRCCSLGSKVNAGATGMYSLGKTRTIYRYKDADPTHTHTYTGSLYESAHPHKEYQTCSCGAKKYTGKTQTVASCTTCRPPVTGVSLDRTTLSLTVGSSAALKATIAPANAYNKTLTWSSSDASVAAVSTAGQVTAKKVGTATITARTADGGKTATCRVTVNAKETPVVPGKLVVKAQNANAAVGKTVQIKIELSQNPGIWGADIKVSYDASAMRLVGIQNGNVFADSELLPLPDDVGNPFTLSFTGAAIQNNEKTGTLAIVTFAVLDNAKAGDYTVKVWADDGAITDKNEKDVACVFTNATVHISNVMIGDINGDGRVTKADLLRLQKHLAGWNVEVVSAACDTNGDGRVTKADLLRLQKYLAGWNVKLGEA